MRNIAIVVACFALLVAAEPGMPSYAGVLTFSNSTLIKVPESEDDGPAFPYPSAIDVADVTNEVTKVTVTLDGINFSCPPDLDVVVVVSCLSQIWSFPWRALA